MSGSVGERYDASTFRVERKGPFTTHESRQMWLVSCERNMVHGKPFIEQEWGWLHREGFFVDFDTNEENTEILAAWNRTSEGLYFPTEAEAQFRLLLYQDPAAALAPFLRATGGAYEGTCGGCKGAGNINEEPMCYTAGSPDDITFLCPTCGRTMAFRKENELAVDKPLCPECLTPCPTCHGTGGPPSRHLLDVASDWFEERGLTIEAEVLRSLK